MKNGGNFSHILFATTIAFLACFKKISDYDFWWHLNLGRGYLRQGTLQLSDSFTYTYAGKEQFNSEWLADILFYKTFDLFGFTGINLLVFFIMIGIFFALYRTAAVTSDRQVNLFAFALTMVFFILAVRFRLFVRPYLFSYLFIGWFTALTFSYCKDSRPVHLWLLIGLELLWANLSKGAFFGPGIIAIILLTARLDRQQRRQLGITLGVVILASLLNPEGFGPYQILFNFVSHGDSAFILGEQQRMSTSLLWGHGLQYTFAYQIIVCCGALYFIIAKGYRNKAFLALFLVFLIPSLIMVRLIGFFSVVGAVFMYLFCEQLFNWLSQRSTTRPLQHLPLALYLFLVITIPSSETYTFGAGAKKEYIPSGAISFAEANNIDGPLINSHPFGGYINWAAPHRKVFLDGRINQLFPLDFHNSYLELLEDTESWSKAEQEWGFEYAIFDYSLRDMGRNFPEHLLGNKNWALVYWDQNSVLFVKRLPKHLPLIERFEYLLAKPSYNQFGYLEHQLKGRISKDLLQQVNKEIANNPDNQEPYLVKAYILYKFNQRGENTKQIRETLEKTLELKPDLSMEYSGIGMIAYQEKDYEKALEWAKRALDIDKSDKGALYIMEKLDKSN